MCSLENTITTERMSRFSSTGVRDTSKIHKDKAILLRVQAHSDNCMSTLHPKQSVNKKQSEI